MNKDLSLVLKREEAAQYIDKLYKFVQNYEHKISKYQWSAQRQVYFGFLNEIVEKSTNDALFSEYLLQHSVLELADAWEKLILTRIHPFVFAVEASDDFKLDFIIEHKITLHHWIEERHLDLQFKVDQDVINVYKLEIAKINQYRAPKDKLVILKNSMDILNNFIESQLVNSGNDNLLPLLILATIRARPGHLMSNIKYIRRFGNSAQQESGAVSFNLTNMISAISFICNMKLDDLTISADEKAERSVQMQAIKDSINASARREPSTADQLGEMASKAFNSTSVFFNKVMKDVKAFGESTVQKIDKTMDAMLNSPTDTNEPSASGSTRVNEPSRFNPNVTPLLDGNNTLSKEEQILLQDYDMQLAMALSLSMSSQPAEEVDVDGLSEKDDIYQ